MTFNEKNGKIFLIPTIEIKPNLNQDENVTAV